MGAQRLAPAEELRWYGGPESGYRRGRGRVLRGMDVLKQSIAAGTDRSPAYIESAHVADIRANILIPIVDAGQVVALLNIDNMSDEDAFGSNALKIAEAYAQHIAVIGRQAETVSNLDARLVTAGL